MASNHTFTFFSLAAMLATGCGSKGNTGDTGAKDAATRQGSGTCYNHDNSGLEECWLPYGAHALEPEINKMTCELTKGEWSDEGCPADFWGWCDYEMIPDSGMLTYHYGSYDPSAQAACDLIGEASGVHGTTWHE